jgi:hypothetical protein
MTFAKVAQMVLGFGPYEGKTLDEIASTDRGLRYLDNLRGKTSNSGAVARALETYLSDPVIAKDLNDTISAANERWEQR